MPTLQKNEKTFPFRSFQGEEPTSEDVRAELEEVYLYLRDNFDDLFAQLTTAIDVHDEVLTFNNDFVLLGGDIIMVIGIPNNNESIWP